MRYHRIYVTVLSVLVPIPLGGHATPLSPRWDDMHVKHSWGAVPLDWESLGHPPAGTTIDLHVALGPHNENALIDALYEVSDPEHERYGAHLSKEQVAELVAPHPGTLKLVNSWLEHYGVPFDSVSVAHGGSALTLTGVSVSQANDLLGASYQLYRHGAMNETILRTVSYALPAVLHGHVQTVVPTTCFVSPFVQGLKSRKGAGAGPAKAELGDPVTVLPSRDDPTTPSYLRWLYSTFAYAPTATDQNVLGVVGHLQDYPSPTDLTTFMDTYRSDGADATFAVVRVNGGLYDPSDPGIEANIDIQYAEAMAYPTPHIFYSTGRGPSGREDRFLSWLHYIIDRPNPPQTISISFGVEEKYYPHDYAFYVCSLYAQLGLRGVSILFASGDDGVGRGNCVDFFGNVQFDPIFPATCPYVTSVGGTTNWLPEVAASFSGGGFSNYFGRPIYQRQAASTFLSNFGAKHQGRYNPFGRGVPDISAQAMNIPIFLKGSLRRVEGTSCSVPIAASIISLLNDHLLSEGKAPLGFLNPWLYGRGLKGLNDIKSGSNPGCNTDGFSAIAGWDPVTGLGTPDFESLYSILTGRND